jgi:hypothetical protein
MWKIIAACVLLTGCAAPYKDFYTGASSSAEVRGVIPHQGPPSVIKTANIKESVKALERKGFVAFGESSFVGPGDGASDRDLAEFGVKLGAEVALLQVDYVGSTTSSVPLTLPSSTTSHSTGNATAFGSGGVVNAYGSSTTTTYGTTTTYIPVTVHRSSYLAVYLAKRKWRLGLHTSTLNDAARRAVERNGGLMVDLVVDDTAAFRANILAGDILLSVGGTQIWSDEQFSTAIDATPAGDVVFQVWRGGKIIDVHVDLPPKL